MDRRIRILAMMMTLLLGVVLIQAANVQFRRSTALASDPRNPRVKALRLNHDRGPILAADGTPLAVSVPTPKAQYKHQRYYPFGSLMSQIVGVDSFDFGRYGIEAVYDNYLVPHKQPANTLNQLLSPTTSTDTVSLTILPKLQQLAASELAGKNGAVVAINPTTGDVKAMYASPTYEPNGLVAQSYKVENAAWSAATTPNAAGFKPLESLAYARTFPPGSTFKVVTASTAYDTRPDLVAKNYPQQTTISFTSSNQTLTNADGGPCGGTIFSMLPPSCDTGFATVGENLGASALFAQAGGFGWNTVPPIDLPNLAVAPSIFPTPATLKNSDALVAYSAIGQFDVRATALQNALDAAAIANGGVVMTPHLMSKITNAQGNLVKVYKPSAWKRATTLGTALTLSEMMQNVVKSGTAGQVGFLPQDQVGAKTGTAQTSLSNVNTTTDDWMIAFAPADHPVIAIAVVVPNQSFSATGAEIAGPIMKCMIEGALAAAAGQPLTGTSTTCPG